MTLTDKYFQRSLFFSLLFLIMACLLLLLFWTKLPPQIPLFYSLPWGLEQLGSPIELLVFPLTTLTAVFLTLASKRFLSSESFLVLLTSLTGAFLSFLSLMALARIIILVI